MCLAGAGFGVLILGCLPRRRCASTVPRYRAFRLVPGRAGSIGRGRGGLSLLLACPAVPRVVVEREAVPVLLLLTEDDEIPRTVPSAQPEGSRFVRTVARVGRDVRP